MEDYRRFLKSQLGKGWDGSETDRKKGLPAPPPQKPYPENTTLIDLVAFKDLSTGKMPLIEAIGNRKSRRKYSEGSLNLPEISFLLWATQGVRKTSHLMGNLVTYRTVPSSGACHPFETYLLINRVEGIEPGLYRYLPLDHLLCFLYQNDALIENVHNACLRQYVSGSAVVFIWTVIPYRSEWQYGRVSHKVLAVDAGHVCQNLYLACEAIGAGMCAIGAYDQENLDRILKVDGKDEFAIYAATVGKVI